MFSIRCKQIVETELNKLGIRFSILELGVVKVFEMITPEQHEKLKIGLLKSGLELMDENKSALIERIKNTIIDVVHYSDELPKSNFSAYITSKLNYDYAYLANLFSEVTGITIEHYIITHKIERVKELLLYDDLSLTQISYLLNYSSVAHLSSQFKKVTGLTPSYFKSRLSHKRRKASGH